MAYNEAGHAVNVANFKELIAFIESLGTEYAPPIAELSVDALKKQAVLLDETVQNLKEAQANHQKAINDRRAVYDSVNPIVTRVMATLDFLGIDAKTLQDARNIAKKIKGVNARKKNASEDDGDATAKTISTSQMSFEQRKNNFERLLALLQAEDRYTTNEDDLKIEALQKLAKALGEVTTKVVEEEQKVVMARQKRNDFLYQEQSGAISIGLRVRSYIKSKFSTKSNEYKRVMNIKLANKK
jgi:hypothetical protein